jgi:hypothetical protein
MKQLFFFILTFSLVVLSGCKTAQPTIVERHTTEHHWHTDTVKERDSVYRENRTVIRELDSAAMAKYGIQLRNAERAWLVQSHELEARLRELEHMIARGDTVRDSIPVPYPVEKEVPAKLTWWQQTRMGIGTWALILTALFVLYKIIRSKMRI